MNNLKTSQKHLVVLQEPSSGNIEIFSSSFPREIGDILTVEGTRMKVVRLLANEKEKQDFIEQWNSLVKKQNASVRRIQKSRNNAMEAKFWSHLYNSNSTIRDCIDTINYCKKNNIN